MWTGHHRTTTNAVAAESAARSFVGSFVEAPDEAVVVLRGELDKDTVERVGVHLEAARAGEARLVTVDAAAVHSYHAGLIDVLAAAQQRLNSRRGMLRVCGLGLSAGPREQSDPTRRTAPDAPPPASAREVTA